MAKRLNKNDIIRGRIFDTIAEVYGSSVLGFYEGKLRIEVIDEETGEVVQFSLAPTVHKVLIDESECDQYVNTDDRIAEYQSSLKKNEEKKPKKKKVAATKTAKESTIENVAPVIKVEEFNFSAPIENTSDDLKVETVVSEDEQAKLDALMSELGI